MKIVKDSLAAQALLVIIAILLPILATFSLCYYQNKAHAIKRSVDDLTIIAEAYEGQVYLFLDKLKRRTEDFASDGLIKTLLRRKTREGRDALPCVSAGKRNAAVDVLSKHLIKNKLSLSKSIKAIIILSMDGRVVAATNSDEIGMDYSRELFFTTTTTMKNHPGHSGLPEIAISTPIYNWGAHSSNNNSDKPVGILVNFVQISCFDEILSGRYPERQGAVSQPKADTWKNMEVYLVNSSKLMLTESRFVKDAVLRQVVDTLPVETGLTSGKEMTGFYKDYRGVEVLGASMFIPSLQWVLLAEIDKGEVLTPVKHILFNALIMGAIVVVMLAALFMVFLKKMVRPLHSISDAARDIACGNLDVAIHATMRNEIGMLCESFNSMARDIKTRANERDLFEKKIRESEEKYRLLVENIPETVWVSDQKGNTTYIGEKVERLCGYTPEEIYTGGENLWFERIHPDDREAVKAAFERLFTSNKMFDVEYRYMKKEGCWVWIHDRAMMTYEKDGVLYACGVFSDISKQKHEEEERQELREQLYHMQKLESIGTLAGGIAHDFNNILAIIMCYGGLLERELENDSMSGEYVQNILEAAKKATTLTNGLLAFSRKGTINTKPVCLNEVVKKMGIIIPGLLGKEIKFETVLTGKNCIIMGNSSHIEQVLMNLITNARDAMPDGGDLIVRTDVVAAGTHCNTPLPGECEGGEYALLSVSDTGIGMDKETQKRIFEPFFTTKDVGKGAGIGLSVVFGIVRQHKGYIEVTSKPGKGTTFKVYLPL